MEGAFYRLQNRLLADSAIQGKIQEGFFLGLLLYSAAFTETVIVLPLGLKTGVKVIVYFELEV